MTIDQDSTSLGDEAYFDREAKGRSFDAHLLEQPLSVLPTRSPLIFGPGDWATDAMRAMQRHHRGCVLVTDDGTSRSKLIGIFTERDVLHRIIDKGRNPATLPLGEVMVTDPESLPIGASVAWVLNKMSVGGFRHVPAVDESDCPMAVVSVRDVVQFLVDHFPAAILNLPPEPGDAPSSSREGA